jgi:hypothetical protein
LDIFFWTHRDRKHYYIKVVESIQFACAGNSGISHALCNANTYRSIHEGLFFNSSPALDRIIDILNMVRVVLIIRSDHRGLLRFFFPSTLKTTREESKMSNFHTTLFQNSFVLVS